MADTERLDQDDQHTHFCKRMSEAFDGLWRARRLPASELLGLRVLELDESQGRAVVEFQARADFCNAMGMVQGGFVAAMLDDAMGIAGTAASGMTRLMLTHEFKVSFLRAAAPGLLVAEG